MVDVTRGGTLVRTFHWKTRMAKLFGAPRTGEEYPGPQTKLSRTRVFLAKIYCQQMVLPKKAVLILPI